MKDVYILGIESSCDEMSASIIKNGTDEIKTIVLSQMDIHKKYGGVVPEIASRCHIESATMVLDELFSNLDIAMEDITAIAVTYGPGLVGSLLVGLQIAKTLSFVYNKPLIPVHHITGHIYANNLVKELKFPLIALVISGGHTDLIYMSNHFKFKKIGGTLDDAVGECYDKVGRVLSLPYPGGPKIDKLASTGKLTYKLPVPLHDKGYNFSFSGLKSAVINLCHKYEQNNQNINKEDLAASFQHVVIEALTSKTIKALKDYHVKNLLLAGGVSANQGIRSNFKQLCAKENINLSYPSLKYCTDNATMVAAAGYFLYQKGKFSSLDLNADSNAKLI